MRYPTHPSALQQHTGLITPVPQAAGLERLGPCPALPRSVWSLLGALLCLLVVVGTSQAAWVNPGPQYILRLCPTHTGGDREYAGHGPSVFGGAYLHTDGTSLYISFYMHQQETQSDWSTARLDVTFWLYTASPGQQITHIWNATRSTFSYVDTNHALDRFSPTDTLVQEFAVMGDTRGNDIGNCTADDAYLSVYLKPIWIWVE
jgi:hypothetical protein